VVFMGWSTWALLCLEDLRKKDADGSIAPIPQSVKSPY
jgi:hypothetical protein